MRARVRSAAARVVIAVYSHMVRKKFVIIHPVSFKIQIRDPYELIKKFFLKVQEKWSQISFALTGLAAHANHLFYRFRTVFRIPCVIRPWYESRVRPVSPSDLACQRPHVQSAKVLLKGPFGDIFSLPCDSGVLPLNLPCVSPTGYFDFLVFL